jgi:hypothetical protein
MSVFSVLPSDAAVDAEAGPRRHRQYLVVNGLLGLGEEAYSAAKAGVINLTQNLGAVRM